MNDRRSAERLYTATVVAFLIGLVALGILGVPALIVAAIGAAIAAVGIALFHRRLEGTGPVAKRGRGDRRKVPAKYVPSVLEGSATQRHRILHLRRHRPASTPVRFR